MGKSALRYTVPLLLTVILSLAIGGCNSAVTDETPVIATSPVASNITPAAVKTTPAAITTPATTPPQTPGQIISDISTAEAYKLIQANGNNPDFIIVDVSTADEYAQGHLENAVLVDYRADNFREEIGKLDRNMKYLIYCRTGMRSAGARDVMKGLGFLDVNNMEGGITDWTAQGYPVVK